MKHTGAGSHKDKFIKVEVSLCMKSTLKTEKAGWNVNEIASLLLLQLIAQGDEINPFHLPGRNWGTNSQNRLAFRSLSTFVECNYMKEDL